MVLKAWFSRTIYIFIFHITLLSCCRAVRLSCCRAVRFYERKKILSGHVISANTYMVRLNVSFGIVVLSRTQSCRAAAQNIGSQCLVDGWWSRPEQEATLLYNSVARSIKLGMSPIHCLAIVCFPWNAVWAAQSERLRSQAAKQKRGISRTAASDYVPHEHRLDVAQNLMQLSCAKRCHTREDMCCPSQYSYMWTKLQ